MRIANSQLVLMALALLFPDQNYQRNPISRHIAKIIEFFDCRILTPPIIVRRPDGSHWIIDGQQRIMALRKTDFTHVWVQLIEVKDAKEEAELFVKVNSAAKALSIQELYKACVYMGTNVASAIEGILSKHSLTGMFAQTNREIKAISKMLEAWGNETPVYQDYDLSGKSSESRNQFNEGKRVLKWAIDAGLPLINKNWSANKVYNGTVLGALIWIRRNHKSTSLVEVRKVLAKAESPDQLRYTIARILGSAGGSRRDLFGVRLSHWMNTQAETPFIKLYLEQWQLLQIHDGIDIANDPAILTPENDPSSMGLDFPIDPAALAYLNTNEFDA